MSLRPKRVDSAEDADFAQQRMAPGGRRWSESPIPRVARRRINVNSIPSLPFGMRVALTNAFEAALEGGWFQLHAYVEYDAGPPEVLPYDAYSDEFHFTGSIAAHDYIPHGFTFPENPEIGWDGPWTYVEVRWHYGDGSSRKALWEGLTEGDVEIGLVTDPEDGYQLIRGE